MSLTQKITYLVQLFNGIYPEHSDQVLVITFTLSDQKFYLTIWSIGSEGPDLETLVDGVINKLQDHLRAKIALLYGGHLKLTKALMALLPENIEMGPAPKHAEDPQEEPKEK